MSCEDCFNGKTEETTWLRVGNGNVKLTGCRRHLGDLILAYNRGRIRPLDEQLAGAKALREAAFKEFGLG